MCLVNGTWWWPPPLKIWNVLLIATCFCATGSGLSGALRAFIGSVGWLDLLNRAKLAFYSAIYRESLDYDDWTIRSLPPDALREIACSVILGPMWGVDMRLRHLDFIAATDASGEFGLGGCTALVSCSTLSRLAKAAERDGEYVTLSDVTDKPRSRSLGTPCGVGLRTKDFNSIFSVRCHGDEHINLREARAVLMYVRWLLRRCDRHRRRVVILVDSKVVVGTITKGRSGSRLLNSILRRISALCFAGGLRLCIMFVPTEHHPGDYPSRGVLIPGSRQKRRTVFRCPGCGCLPLDHPRHVPKRHRGIGIQCNGANGSYSCDHDHQQWVPAHVLTYLHAQGLDPNSGLTRDIGGALDEDDEWLPEIGLEEILLRSGRAPPRG